MRSDLTNHLEIKSIKQAFREELAYIKGRFDGSIKSARLAWRSWNDIYTDGFEWGWIVTIAGLSGVGKTALLNIIETQIIQCNPETKISVLSYNFEMLARRLVGRKISAHLGKTVKQLYSADKGNNVTESDLEYIEHDIADELTKYDISYIEMPGTVDEIYNSADQFILNKKKEDPTTHVVISLDHSILVKKVKGSERDTLTELMTCFNELKKRHPDCLFLILSQLNRNVEDESRKKQFGPERILNFPQKSDIFGSESLFQFSDAVIIFHRPELLGLQTYGPKSLPVENLVYCHHLKARDGMPKITRLSNKLHVNSLDEVL